MNLEVDDRASMSLRGRDWWIGLEGWVLQDGNYTDFATGERRQFALEFGYRRDRRLRAETSAASPAVRYAGRGASYEVTGQLIRSAAAPHDDGFVLDFGLRAYSNWVVLDDLEPPVAPDWLTGEIHLGVDPFFYIDELARLPEMPELIYTWTVVEIQLDTTPGVRDPQRESWRTIDRTRMWDDEGNYRLRCRLDDLEPAGSMRATGSRSPYGPLEPGRGGDPVAARLSDR